MWILLIDEFVEQLDININEISEWLDPKIVSFLSNSSNSLNLILDSQSVVFTISWDTMYLYEIKAKWFWVNLMLQLIKKAIDNWLRYIKIEAKPLWLIKGTNEYDEIMKYLFSFYSSFWFENTLGSNYFTLDLDNDKLIEVLSNKLILYLNTKKWIKL